MVFGNIMTKVALIDQMIYYLKELMIEAVEDFMIP